MKVSGKVYSEDGTALPGANVLYITPKGESTSIGVATTSTGAFSLDIPSGEGSLQISFIGFETRRIAVSQLPFIITLRPGIALSEAEVIANTSKSSTTAKGQQVMMAGGLLLLLLLLVRKKSEK